MTIDVIYKHSSYSHNKIPKHILSLGHDLYWKNINIKKKDHKDVSNKNTYCFIWIVFKKTKKNYKHKNITHSVTFQRF